MTLLDLRVTDLRLTSLEILEQINIFRKEENRGELQHNDLLKIIRDEFEEEISLGKISQSEYTNERGRKYLMFRLETDQAKQILMRESKLVRKKVVAYIKTLEQKLIDLQNEKNSKKLQLQLMEDLHNCLPELEQGEVLSYIKANTVVNKVVSDMYGFPKMLKKFEMNSEMLMARDLVLNDYVKLYEIIGNNTDVRTTLVNKYMKLLLTN